MKALRELVHIVTNYKTRSIEIVGESIKNQRIGELYDGILDGTFSNDADAAQHFFNDSAKNPNYRKLKNNLKKRLINTSFFIDTSQTSFNDLQKAYYNCHKLWAANKIFVGRSARHAATEISEKILTQAIKYEFTFLVVDIANYLRGYYGGMIGDKVRYRKYKALYYEYKDIWLAEMEAEGFYIDLITNYTQNKSTKTFVKEIAEEYLAELKDALDKYDTHRLHLYAYLIMIVKDSSVNDYLSMKATCEKAIEFFKSKQAHSKVALASFLHQLVVSNVQLKEYKDARDAAVLSSELMEYGTNNWFKSLDLHLLVCLHSGAYRDAYDVYQKAIRHKRFKTIYKNNMENWKLYEAYIYYLIGAGKIQFSFEEESKLKPFRLGKFLNEVPTFAKDKRGKNIPVLVIQILFMIQKRKYDAAVDRIATIEKYCARHLRKDDTYRSNVFIKMLNLISKSHFHKAAVLRKTEKYREALHAVPPESAGQSFEIEIIPYETLWDFILEHLDNRFH